MGRKNIFVVSLSLNLLFFHASFAMFGSTGFGGGGGFGQQQQQQPSVFGQQQQQQPAFGGAAGGGGGKNPRVHLTCFV